MLPRLILKRSAQFGSLVLALPAGLVCCFGRLRAPYTLLAHLFALFPGIIGDYLRVAFYRMTLISCAADTRIGFGTVFVHPEASVGPFVSIGLYCIIGRATIGTRTQIGSMVQIPSGRYQHARGEEGKLLGAEPPDLPQTLVGEDCWIGASAVIMARVGDGTTVGAGAVVVHDLPPGVTAAGNPARVIRETANC